MASDRILNFNQLVETSWTGRAKDQPIAETPLRSTVPEAQGVQVLGAETAFDFIRERSVGSATKVICALVVNEFTQVEERGEMLILEHGGPGGATIPNIEPAMILRVKRDPLLRRFILSSATLSTPKPGVLRSLEVDFPTWFLGRLGLLSYQAQRLAVAILFQAAITRLPRERKKVHFLDS